MGQHSRGREKCLGLKCDKLDGLVTGEVKVEILKHHTKTKAAKNTTVDSLVWQVDIVALSIGIAASKLTQRGHILKALQLRLV